MIANLRSAKDQNLRIAAASRTSKPPERATAKEGRQQYTQSHTGFVMASLSAQERKKRLEQLENELGTSRGRLGELFRSVEVLPRIDDAKSSIAPNLKDTYFSQDSPNVVQIFQSIEASIESYCASELAKEISIATEAALSPTPAQAQNDPQPSLTTINPSSLSVSVNDKNIANEQQQTANFTPSYFGINGHTEDHSDEKENYDGLSEQLPDWARWNLPEDVVVSRLTVGGLLNKIRQTRDTNRDREKGGAVGGGTELYKLGLVKPHAGQSIRTLLSADKKHQPVTGARPRSGKVLSSKEWMVAHAELRTQRALELIEKAKTEGKWVFRQPKKHKAPSIPKAHWDYLLEEMKWMHTDFRQERRAKIVVSYQLAKAVKMWHRASPEERKAMQVNVRSVSSDDNATSHSLCDGPDNKTMDFEANPESSISTSHNEQTTTPLSDVDGEIEADTNLDADDADVDATGEEDDAEGEIDADDVESSSKPTNLRSQDLLEVEKATEIKESSELSKETMEVTPNPEFQDDESVIQHPAQSEQSSPQSFQTLVAAREPIFDLPVTTTSVDARLLNIDSKKIDANFFNTYLPDLPLYELPLHSTDITKAEKRFDESTPHYSRIAHHSKLLDLKPFLLSTLQPSKKRKRDGTWADISEVISEKPRDQNESRPEVPPGCVLFTGKKPKDVTLAPLVHAPVEPPNAEARAGNFDWTSEEDNILLAYSKQYAYNWHLIADIFNIATKRVSTDMRIPWDMYNRWNKRFGPGSQASASASDLSSAKKDKKKAVSKYEGPKKKLRHICLYDAMRKLQKKRETAAAVKQNIPRRVNLNAHESHMQPARPAYSPLELSRFKGERDRYTEIQKRQQELARQQFAQAAVAVQAQVAQQQGGGSSSTPLPNGQNGQNNVGPSTHRPQNQIGQHVRASSQSGTPGPGGPTPSSPVAGIQNPSPRSTSGTPPVNGTNNPAPMTTQTTQNQPQLPTQAQLAAMAANMGGGLRQQPSLNVQHAGAALQMQMQMQNLTAPQQMMLASRQFANMGTNMGSNMGPSMGTNIGPNIGTNMSTNMGVNVDAQTVMNYLQAQQAPPQQPPVQRSTSPASPG